MANKILPVADALKQVYTALGGNDDEVLDMSTNTELIQEIAGVATGGGSSLPSVTDADEGKVLTVDSSGEWAAETPSGVPVVIIYPIDSEGTIAVSGDYETCRNSLLEDNPVIAYYFAHASGTTYFRFSEYLGIAYDEENLRLILMVDSTRGWYWNADGTIVAFD